MYVDYQASVVFRKLAIENGARPIKRHDEKSRDSISLRIARRTDESSSTRIKAGFASVTKKQFVSEGALVAITPAPRSAWTILVCPRNRTLVGSALATIDRADSSDQGPICSHARHRQYATAMPKEPLLGQ
jgi:hypothetical protein